VRGLLTRQNITANIVAAHRYKGKERLLAQLLKAIKDTEGFHII